MLKEFAKLFVKAVVADGILEDGYIERRGQRYLEEVERGAVKKIHIDETPKNYGKRPKKKKNKMQRAMEEQKTLSNALELIKDDTENEIPKKDRAGKSECA